jgi:myo-inositol-1(or 4)-monophosphatase
MLQVAVRAAHEAGRVLVERYHQPHEIDIKGLRDIVTEADLAAETTVIRVVRDACPGARFVSEESYSDADPAPDEPAWYIDPLDGTTNYARGLPMFSVSVAMAQHGAVQCGVVYDPLLDQLFHAERGGGAYLNGQPLHVSARQQLGDCVILMDWPRDPSYRQQALDFLTRLAPRVDAVRSRGSAAHGICCVAAGWADAYFQFTLSPWDVAAATLILAEAGGRATDLRGGPPALRKRDWLATNGAIHEHVLALEPYGSVRVG